MRLCYLFYRRHCECSEAIHLTMAGLLRRRCLLAMTKQGQHGGVLVWILIAVALFTALSFTMSQGSRTSTGMITDAQARLYATEIIAYGNDVKEAVRRLRIGGVAETGLGFDNDVFKHVGGDLIHPAGHNPNCMSDSCKIFHPSGGSIMAKYPSVEALAVHPSPTSTSYTAGAGDAVAPVIDGVGTGERDLVFRFSLIKKEVCVKINDLLGVPNPGGRPPAFTPGPNFDYNGAFPVSGATYSGGVVQNQAAYCFQALNQPWNYIYMVTVIAR